jgi:hypothetical protein
MKRCASCTHYLYSIPEYGQLLISNTYDLFEEYINDLKDDYTARLENEEIKFLAGRSSKTRYDAVKQKYNQFIMKILK